MQRVVLSANPDDLAVVVRRLAGFFKSVKMSETLIEWSVCRETYNRKIPYNPDNRYRLTSQSDDKCGKSHGLVRGSPRRDYLRNHRMSGTD